MRKLIAIICMAVASPVWAAFDTAGWSWERPIDSEIDTAGFARLIVEPEVFDESQPSLADLRVLDHNGMQVPHVLHWGRTSDEERVRWRDMELLNRSFRAGRYERVMVDYGRAADKNRLFVDLSGENYRRRVQVDGSADSESWDTILDNGWLFDVSVPSHHMKVQELTFSRNNYRYLRITVFHMEDDKRRVEIKSVKSSNVERLREKELAPVNIRERTSLFDEENKQSVYELDLGYKNLPLAQIRIKSDEPYFYRGYNVDGRNAAREKIERKTETGWDTVERDVPWRRMRGGVLYRIREDEHVSTGGLEGSLNGAYRHLRLTVHEGDNPPLKIDGIEIYMREVSMVFKYEPGKTYTLIGGNPKAAMAQYDLARAIRSVDEVEAPVVTAGAAVAIIHAPEPGPLSERFGAVLTAGVVLGVIVMLVMVFKSLREVKETGTEDE